MAYDGITRGQSRSLTFRVAANSIRIAVAGQIDRYDTVRARENSSEVLQDITTQPSKPLK